MTKKQVPFERFEIVDRRVKSGRVSRAFIQFVILPARGGDALSWAAARCQGRAKPIEIQVYFEWSKYLGSWTPLWTRGEGDDDLCSGGKLWTPRQIEQMVDPAPLPEPPRISMADVYTPPQGSIERTAIMDALRPRYETLFGAPIVFRVEKLRVAAGFAFVVIHPQRPNGAPIESTLWKRALGDQCFQEPISVAHEYWMRKEGAQWTIGISNGMCADDSISQEGDLIGAPALLVGRNAWPERDTFPEPK